MCEWPVERLPRDLPSFDNGFRWHRLALTRIEGTVRESQAIVVEIKRWVEDIPNVLCHSWETGYAHAGRSVVLRDMLGQTIQTPIDPRGTWKVRSILNVCF